MLAFASLRLLLLLVLLFLSSPSFSHPIMASYPIFLRRLLRPRSSFSLAASLPYFVHPFF
jgi:hypothetical protein